MSLIVKEKEFKKNFELYLIKIENGEKIYLSKDDEFKPYGVFRILNESDTPYTDTLLGAAEGIVDFDKARDEYFKEKYHLN